MGPSVVSTSVIYVEQLFRQQDFAVSRPRNSVSLCVALLKNYEKTIKFLLTRADDSSRLEPYERTNTL